FIPDPVQSANKCQPHWPKHKKDCANKCLTNVFSGKQDPFSAKVAPFPGTSNLPFPSPDA
uniref:Uncharacterized protein n=1 Tax=Aegilops tauschii subsp. strangulata TaxID=200361 RepID=A0A453IRU3_AEGTS